MSKELQCLTCCHKHVCKKYAEFCEDVCGDYMPKVFYLTKEKENAYRTDKVEEAKNFSLYANGCYAENF